MFSCPACGSQTTAIFDKGWKKFFRLVSFNPRILCSSCRTSWRRKDPHRLTKVKRKFRRRGGAETVYTKIDFPDDLKELEPSRIDDLVWRWREDGMRFVCLDVIQTPRPTSATLGAIMSAYRQLKSGGGDLIIENDNPVWNDWLWRANLGYLIRSHQITRPFSE